MANAEPYSFEYGRLESHQGEDSEVYFFTPNDKALTITRMAMPEHRALVRIDYATATIELYPIVTSPLTQDFLSPKYKQIETLRLSFTDYRPGDSSDLRDILETLPIGFARQVEYGLGLQRVYRPIVEAVEGSTECRCIELTRETPSEAIQENTFRLGEAQFESLRAELYRMNARAMTVSRRIRRWRSQNFIAPLIGEQQTELGRGKHPIIKTISDEVSGDRALSSSEIEEVGQAILQSPRIRTKPEALAKLKQDVDLVNLETLLANFSDNLRKSTRESFWQDFFQSNPFALHLAYGFPIIQIQEQASVGGRRLDGAGEKYSDFFAKNLHTNNVGLFEIKRPDSPLLAGTPYRAGLYGPSPHLVGAMNQLLDQRYQLAKHLPALKDSARDSSMESYSIRGCLIIGTLEGLSPDQLKSFELFRGNSAAIDVITFDELLSRLKNLHAAIRDDS